jgi:hypothetical protein
MPATVLPILTVVAVAVLTLPVIELLILTSNIEVL